MFIFLILVIENILLLLFEIVVIEGMIWFMVENDEFFFGYIDF